MTGICKHKAAAASIDWMASLLKGKSGADRAATMAALSSMLAEMIEANCRTCTELGVCHDLDKASRVLSANPAQPGPEVRLAPQAMERLPRRGRLSASDRDGT